MQLPIDKTQAATTLFVCWLPGCLAGGGKQVVAAWKGESGRVGSFDHRGEQEKKAPVFARYPHNLMMDNSAGGYPFPSLSPTKTLYVERAVRGGRDMADAMVLDTEQHRLGTDVVLPYVSLQPDYAQARIDVAQGLHGIDKAWLSAYALNAPRGSIHTKVLLSPGDAGARQRGAVSVVLDSATAGALQVQVAENSDVSVPTVGRRTCTGRATHTILTVLTRCPILALPLA